MYTIADYHADQWEYNHITNCLYGGFFGDMASADGLWFGIAPAMVGKEYSYGSRLSKN